MEKVSHLENSVDRLKVISGSFMLKENHGAKAYEENLMDEAHKE